MSKAFSRLSCCCVLGLGLALSLSTSVAARGATKYYVDAAAKKGKGTVRSPFATIQQAADVARAGDVVFIKPGTYCESVKPKSSGKEGSPIVFRNRPGEERPTHVICPKCGYDYELNDGSVRECECGHIFDGSEENLRLTCSIFL